MISLSNIQAQASQVANLLGLQGQWNLLPTRYNGIDIQVFGSTGILDSIENFSLDDPNYFADVTFIGDFSQKMLVEYLIPNQSGSRFDDFGWTGERFNILGFIYGEKYENKITEIRNILATDSDFDQWKSLVTRLQADKNLSLNQAITPISSYFTAKKSTIKDEDYRQFTHPTLGKINDCRISDIRIMHGQGRQQAAIVQLTLVASSPITRDSLNMKGQARSFWDSVFHILSMINNAINFIRNAINVVTAVYQVFFNNKQNVTTFTPSVKNIAQNPIRANHQTRVNSTQSSANLLDNLNHSTALSDTLESFVATSLDFIQLAADIPTKYIIQRDKTGLIQQVNRDNSTAAKQNSSTTTTSATSSLSGSVTLGGSSSRIKSQAIAANFNDYATSQIRAYREQVEGSISQLKLVNNLDMANAIKDLRSTVLTLDSIAKMISTILSGKKLKMTNEYETTLLHLFYYNNLNYKNMNTAMLLNRDKINNPLKVEAGIPVVLG